MTTAAKLRCDESLERLREHFAATGDAVRTVAERTALVDRVVLQAAAQFLFHTPASGVALVAVGGYGRRDLFPYSDVDLLLLFAGERAAQQSKEPLALFLRELWDSGLRVSHSVRTPQECAELHDRNIELNVSLLDQRFVGGDRALYAELARRMPRFIHSQREALARNLCRLARERHGKFQGTFYHLEPNIKDAPGGLRDFHLVCWLEQLREATPDHLAAAQPAPEVAEAARFLARLRCHLHFASRRDNNVLTFELQEAIAPLANGAGPAACMREYFRHARAISRTALRSVENTEARASSLFAQFRDWRSRLSNADFTVVRERVHFRAPQQLEASPELLLRLAAFIARHGIPASAEAEERVRTSLARFSGWVAETRPLWLALREILSLPHAPLAVRFLHESGALWVLFPELRPIECLVIRDFYHRYTVDEHTLVAMQIVSELGGRQDSVAKGYAGLCSEIDDPALLQFALLFHDSGKGASGREHVDASLELAGQAMSRTGMPEDGREMVRFLIGAHLEMSAAIHSRDLYDPATARYMAGRVTTIERLKALTLLTFADISAVHPAAMTLWRAEQLWQLYLLTYNELTRELESDRIETALSEPAERAAFLDGFPTRYLRTHTESEIAQHLLLEEESRARGAGIEMKRTASAWKLTLVAADRPYLFASAAGTLAGFGMNILKAEAFANRQGTVLDTFSFADPCRTLDLNPAEVDRLRLTLERAILGKIDVRKLLQNRRGALHAGRRGRIAATVSFDSDASAAATLIQITAEDRPGLLYDLSSAISGEGGNIEVVLVDTEAHKAIDVFYVTAAGAKLDAQKILSLEAALRNVCGTGG